MGSLSAEEDGSSIEISDEYVLDAVVNGKVLLLHSRICTTPLGLGIWTYVGCCNECFERSSDRKYRCHV